MRCANSREHRSRGTTRSQGKRGATRARPWRSSFGCGDAATARPRFLVHPKAWVLLHPDLAPRAVASCERYMDILFLSEGDSESWDAWSGISKSLVQELRSAGHVVVTGDADLHGPDRLLGAALTFSVDRRRWGTRFHLSGPPFRLRSRSAARHIAAHRGRLDVIVQTGATFQPLGRGTIPYFLCCDSNIRMAEHGAASGHSDAVSLTRRELERGGSERRASTAMQRASSP